MSFWIQHGYGKGDKLDRLADAGALGGVVLSPADEDRPGLVALSANLRDRSIAAVLDPQLYVYSIPGGTGRCHDKNELEFPDLAWSEGTKVVEKHVEAVIAANKRLRLETYVAPSPLPSTF